MAVTTQNSLYDLQPSRNGSLPIIFREGSSKSNTTVEIKDKVVAYVLEFFFDDDFIYYRHFPGSEPKIKYILENNLHFRSFDSASVVIKRSNHVTLPPSAVFRVECSADVPKTEGCQIERKR